MSDMKSRHERLRMQAHTKHDRDSAKLRATAAAIKIVMELLYPGGAHFAQLRASALTGNQKNLAFWARLQRLTRSSHRLEHNEDLTPTGTIARSCSINVAPTANTDDQPQTDKRRQYGRP